MWQVMITTSLSEDGSLVNWYSNKVKSYDEAADASKRAVDLLLHVTQVRITHIGVLK